MHRADERDIIHAFRRMGQQVGDFHAAPAVFLEAPFGTQKLRIIGHELILRFAEFLRPLLTVELIQQRFGIKRLDMAGAARHEQEDYGLRFGRMMRRLGGKRIVASGPKLLLK